MANSGRNEGFRMLEEFTCEAVSSPHAARLGRGVNPGMRVLTETVVTSDQPSMTTERVDQLRRMSTPELLDLVKHSGQELDSRELLAIHDIAAERLGENDVPFSEVAIELSRQTMLVAVNRSA